MNAKDANTYSIAQEYLIEKGVSTIWWKLKVAS